MPSSILSGAARGRVARLIRDRRLGLGLTQEQLAVKLGVSHNTVALWEAGREPSRTSRRLLADHLGGSPSDYRED